ncbi:AAA family ATPase [Flavobacterium sp. YO12]|uniref:AAA family ATPase n=1 Tax=Flavobacterium sp. YO12 TaxID=1920029 RepID=UPI00100B7957|nr:AAA family ATPase [Flavobacterium sp. YO12]RXM43913.1 hypothetical protein BOW55_18385 [Flavobacterium sp. YO12]
MCFKIIAVQPGSGIKDDYLKNLKKGEIYYLDSDYTIQENEINHAATYPADFFNKKAGLNIEISAIVGRNGSGKSSLIDLLIMGINNIFHFYKAAEKKRDYHYTKKLDGLSLCIYYRLAERLIKIDIQDEGLLLYKYCYDEDSQAYKQNPVSIELNLASIENLFFYTEVINYSLYSFNSQTKDYGWVKHIFHKNDGYQTPIVLNPFRKNGNIDIDTENFLSSQRFLANIFRPGSKKQLTNNLSLNKVSLKLREPINLSKIEYNEAYYDLSENNVEDVFKKISYYFGVTEESNLAPELLKKSKEYLVYKLANIALKYQEYNSYFTTKKRDKESSTTIEDMIKNYPHHILTFKNLDAFLIKLPDDTSHITLKLRQTINFIRHNNLLINAQNEIEIGSAYRDKGLISDDYLPFLPPPIYRVFIKLKEKTSQKEVDFISLSSGEKQLIYSLNSLYYHLINLDSVTKVKDKYKIAYQNINVILDEIELYFHPEYQRKYIMELLNGISNLKFRQIKSINFILATHSPFILSDLPSACVLKLQDGAPYASEKGSTFGANIYDMLKDSFFLENGFIGDFAQEKIGSLLKYLQSKNGVDKEWNAQKALKVIEFIGEPLIRERLQFLYDKKFLKRAEIEQKILKLQQQLQNTNL